MTAQATIEASTTAQKAQTTGQWLTLQEASKISGRSVNALTILINRGKLDRSRKVNGKGHGKWLIHRDSLQKMMEFDLSVNLSTAQESSSHTTAQKGQTGQESSEPSIPLSHYEKKRDEWQEERDRLQAGLLMYRYKFEELDRQMKMLPAPVEIIPAKLSELEAQAAELADNKQTIVRSQETIKALEEALQSERQRSWWDRLWKK